MDPILFFGLAQSDRIKNSCFRWWWFYFHQASQHTKTAKHKRSFRWHTFKMKVNHSWSGMVMAGPIPWSRWVHLKNRKEDCMQIGECLYERISPCRWNKSGGGGPNLDCTKLPVEPADLCPIPWGKLHNVDIQGHTNRSKMGVGWMYIDKLFMPGGLHYISGSEAPKFSWIPCLLQINPI